ncbi:MAG: hypothetical protein RSF02_02880 [Bacilli bacterium]
MERNSKVLKNALISSIKNGVLEDGEVRSFDVLDYYKLTDIKLEEVFDYLKEKVDFTRDEVYVLKSFVQKFSLPVGRHLNVENFIASCLEETDIIGGIEITNDTRLEAFDYLIINRIPINQKTYMTYLRRSVLEMKKQAQIVTIHTHKS